MSRMVPLLEPRTQKMAKRVPLGSQARKVSRDEGFYNPLRTVIKLVSFNILLGFIETKNSSQGGYRFKV